MVNGQNFKDHGCRRDWRRVRCRLRYAPADIRATAFLLVHSFIFCAGIKVSGVEIQFQVKLNQKVSQNRRWRLSNNQQSARVLQSGSIFSSGKWSGILHDHPNPFTTRFLSNSPLCDFRDRRWCKMLPWRVSKTTSFYYTVAFLGDRAGSQIFAK